MILYLHEFPSSEGICFVTQFENRAIKFQYYSVSFKKYYTIQIIFKYCDIKVQIKSIECLDVYIVINPEKLLLFKQPCIELFKIFHKYNQYLWAPTAQIPKQLIDQFFDIIMQLKLENP